MMELVDWFAKDWGLPELAVKVVVGLLVVAGIKPALELLWRLGGPPLRAVIRFVRPRSGARVGDGHEGSERASDRANFAADQIGRLQDIDRDARWQDRRFTDLEAEVETHVAGRPEGLQRFLPARAQTRREKSLTAALERFGLDKVRKRRLGWRPNKLRPDQGRLVAFLHGAPGSGKSVALRRVARTLAERAASDPDHNVVPIYINLKTLVPLNGRVDASTIRDFVFAQLTEGVPHDTAEFVERQFTTSVREGRWLFLLDSFDEIPAVLASTEYDDNVTLYASAIKRFLESSLNTCSAVIASRQFKAPPGYGWPTFTIQPLSRGRQRQLVRNTDLAASDRQLILRSLPDADSGIVHMAENPMFLALLCDYVGATRDFPTTMEQVFDTHLSLRLRNDAERVRRRGFPPDRLRRGAEELAFVMTGWSRGIRVPRQALIARREERFPVDPKVPLLMDTLEYLRIAKRGGNAALSIDALDREEAEDPRWFEFEHRRIQEYFAASLIVRDPTLMDVDTLLRDGRWREVAVTLCQAHPKLASPLLARAAEFLAEQAARIDPSASLQFSLPPDVRQVLGLLQEAFRSGKQELPAAIREPATRLLRATYDSEHIFNRWSAVELAGTATDEDLIALLRAGFGSGSSWLSDSAYSQVGWLRRLHPDISRAIRRSLVKLCGARRLYGERVTQHAQLKRLVDPTDALQALAQLVTATRVNLVGHAALTIVVFLSLYWSPPTLALYLLVTWASFLAFQDIARLVAEGTVQSRQRSRQTFRAAATAAARVLRRAPSQLRRRESKRAAPRLGTAAKRPPVRFRVVLRVVARLCLTLLLLLIVAGYAWAGSWWALPWTVLLASLVWPPGILVAVARGEYLGRVRQLLAPMSLLKAALEHARLFPLWTYLLSLAGFVLLVGVLALLAEVRLEDPTAQWISFGITLAGLLVLLVAGTRLLVANQLHDWRLFRRLRSAQPLQLSQEEFVAQLEQHRTPTGVLRLLIFVRTNDLLAASDVTDLVLDLEEIATYDEPGADASVASQCRCDWTQRWLELRDPRHVRAIRQAGPEFVDELGRLVRQQSERPSAIALV